MRELRDAGQRLAVLRLRDQVADHEDLAGDRAPTDRPRPRRARRDRAARPGGWSAGWRARRPPTARCAWRCTRRRSRRSPSPRSVTRVPVRTSMPSAFELPLRLARTAPPGSVDRTRGPASIRITRVVRGSKRRKSRASVRPAISASAPASSTPVGPPPITTNVVQARRASADGLQLGGLERAQDAPAHVQRFADRSSARARSAAHLSLPKYAWVIPVASDQVVVVDVAALERARASSRPRCAGPPPSGRWRCAAARAACGSAPRCRARPAPPSRPGRAAAGTGGGCCDRSA